MRDETTSEWAARAVAETLQPGMYIDVHMLTVLAKTDRKRAYQLALIYLNGTHGEQVNEERALSLFKFSADEGCIDAMLMAGRLLEIRGLTGGAVQYYRMAAKLGDRRAQKKLAQPTRTEPPVELIVYDGEPPLVWPVEPAEETSQPKNTTDKELS